MCVCVCASYRVQRAGRKRQVELESHSRQEAGGSVAVGDGVVPSFGVARRGRGGARRHGAGFWSSRGGQDLCGDPLIGRADGL